MSGLRIPAAGFEPLTRALLEDAETERCAIGYAHYDAYAANWVLAAAAPVEDDAYAGRGPAFASLKPEALVAIANHARASGLSPIFIHTHPFDAGVPRFSAIDDAGEAEILAYLERRAPEARALAMVIGQGGLRARILGKAAPVKVWEVGSSLRLLSASRENTVGVAERHDRQLRAFGPAGQRMIASLKVLVVGAGGTGSAILQQLAYLGAEEVTIIDPDRVEATNLNRVIGATPGDIGVPKVEMARRYMLAINPEARVQAIVGDIVDAAHANRIAAHDFVFLCTDSHASRAVVGQAAYQHLIPAIDMGVSLTVADGQVSHITGRVQMLAPGLPCLSCTRALDGEQIRREMLTPEQRAADPYVIGGHAPQPAVISLNSTMASLAITMFLSAVTPIPAAARFQYYDGLRGTVRPTTASMSASCVVCSKDGALAQGISWPLPVRPGRTRHD